MQAILFPGQGSQAVGMGESLIKDFQPARVVFEEASDTLGFDMTKLCLEGPTDKLQLTENTQPALLTHSIATLNALKSRVDLNIKACAGHSVGEYAALVASGVISFSKAVELVRLRGQLMQKAVPVGKGGMLAVMGLDPDEVIQLCDWAAKKCGEGPLEPANYNSPNQIVVSGNSKAVEFAAKNFKPEVIDSDKKKVRLIPLKVSAPFHCSMMLDAEKEMAGAINDVEFEVPEFSISQNFTGKLEAEPKIIKTNIIKQISGAVRWVDCIEAISETGDVDHYLELGSGKVLTGLLKKINLDLQGQSIGSSEDINQFTESQN
jgi:[acyl-carrier-protein] S-malonyltransferase